MATSELVVPMDNELKAQAQSVLDGWGLDITTIITDLLKHVAYRKTLPTEISPEKLEQIRQKRNAFLGCMKDEIWMADDFNAPLEEMKEYM
ncbi:MAG: DUF2281 domain-containing protein [Defluviitaleaceae bacterium]|nr:DUF2281 domain-containing protein [Defluviitaleaceae bacterium]